MWPIERQPAVNPSLVRTLTLRLAMASLLAMALQLGIVAARSYLDQEALLDAYVNHEASALSRALRPETAEPRIQRRDFPQHYRQDRAAAYAFRVLARDGRVIAEHNGGELAAISPWAVMPSENQDLWLRNLDPDKHMFVAGGVRQRRGDKEFWVEVLTRGDPAHAHLRILAIDVLDDVWMPMIPLVVLTLGVAILSVRRALQPLVAAADRADATTLAQLDRQFDASQLPREAASFVTAINSLLDRVNQLVLSQRLFIARAAHELRTPLSIMLLELERIDDKRVRRLEADVRNMSDLVNQLLTLARLESVQEVAREPVDLTALAEEVVDRLGDWARTSGHKLTLDGADTVAVRGDRVGLREAMRNLVENAVKHTPAKSAVHVRVLPGAHIVVEDDGPGIDDATAAEMFEPFKKGNSASEGAGLGLAIVRQTAELHKGALKVDRSPLGGARFDLYIPA